MAEEAGKTKTAAVLAYNLAELRLRYLPDADAITPARRVAEIKESGVEIAIDQEDIDILLSLSEYLQKESGLNLKLLTRAVKNYKTSEKVATYSVFIAQMNLITNAINRNKWQGVNGLSIDAQKSFQENELSDTNLLLDLKFLQIASLITFDKEFKAKTYQPVFQDIYNLLKPGPFNKVGDRYLKFRAWIGTVNSYLSQGLQKRGEVIELIYRDPADPYVANQHDGLCPDFIWDKKAPPKYPSLQLERGYIGSAVIIFNLNEYGEPKKVSVGAEVPSKQFGVYAVRAVKNWRGHFTSKPSDACLARQRTAIMKFIILEE
ncbi:MAG: energy transducer TonB [Robiginitomaculum sp.]|nr:energy transducer TonB [Robiginitomaculum sp.]